MPTCLKNNIFKTISNALALLIVLTFSSCFSNKTEELQAVEDEQERPSLIVRDLHTIVTDSGFIKYDFETSDLAQYDNVDEPYINFPKGLTFKMYSDEGRNLKTTIKCNNAKFYKTQNLWELNNDVEARTGKGDLLNSEQLFWNTKEHRIYSDKFVRISTKNQVITGYGFESDEKMSKYEIKNPGGEIEIPNVQRNTTD
ncbi:MAG: LPS export ABC transporter periplasmic protein LptC [Bacteroidales bacterium]|nr:LPS export ABC transporter periplasmic protein LptC [Bacteroidales bacterium]